MEFFSLLLNPKLLAIFGPIGAILISVCVMLYRFYREERKRAIDAEKKNDEIQEKRLKEAVEMSKDYHELVSDMDKTLDAVLKVIRRPKNGNGS